MEADGIGGTRRVRRIFLDPGHENAFGLLLLVPAETGIVFQHQAGGLVCDQHDVEGFLVPLAGNREEVIIADWFAARFRGRSRIEDWTEHDYEDLDALLSDVASYGEDGARQPLSLDWTRKAETSEAWIPVHSALGDGWLIFENSD